MGLFLFLLIGGTGPQSERFDCRQNLVYAEVHGVGLLLDVFQPRGNKNGLAIIDIASGSFASGRDKIDKHRQTGLFDELCGRGYTVFAVRPGSLSKFTAGEMVVNVRTAIGWVKKRGSAYQIDTERLGLTGASAGGHLALIAACTEFSPGPSSNGTTDTSSSSGVHAVCAFFPPTDFLDFGYRKTSVETIDTLPKIVADLLLGDARSALSKSEQFALVERLCPARRVSPHSPPVLLIHGDKDLIVPFQQSTRMVAALKAEKIPTELVVMKGIGHGWAAMAREVRTAANWFDRVLTEPEPASRTTRAKANGKSATPAGGNG